MPGITLIVLLAISWLVAGVLVLHVMRLRKVEKKVHEDLAFNKALLDSVGEGVVVIDQKGDITLVNRATEQMIGWTSEEMKGKKWYDVAPLIDEKGEIISPELRSTKIVIETGRPRYNAKYSYVRRDGSNFPVATTVAPVTFNGKTLGVIALFRDVALERQADRAKSEFVALASHQLRTPLSAIKWFAEILLSGDAGELPKEQKEYVDNIFQSNERMIDLVNSLLNVSRVDSGRIIIDPRPTDLGKLVESVVKSLEVKIIEKNIKMAIDVAKGIPEVSIDPRLISQVYMNLLTNSIKYTPDGGTVMVVISLKDKEVVSQVTDTGYGIPEKDKDKMFQKFHRGSNIIKLETDGTGLGLYLAKAVVVSSGGRIWYESTEGKGTSFWFTLPLEGSPVHEGEVTLT